MAIVKKEDIIRITAERLDYANNSFSITAETLVSIDDPDDDQLPIKELKMSLGGNQVLHLQLF